MLTIKEYLMGLDPVTILLSCIAIFLLVIFRKDIIPSIKTAAIEIWRGLSDGDFQVNNIKGLVNIILVIVLISEFFHYYLVDGWQLNETLVGTILLYVLGNGVAENNKEIRLKKLDTYQNEETES